MINSEYLMVHNIMITKLVLTSAKPGISCLSSNGFRLTVERIYRDLKMQNYSQFTNKRLGQMCTKIIVQCSNGRASWRKLIIQDSYNSAESNSVISSRIVKIVRFVIC